MRLLFLSLGLVQRFVSNIQIYVVHIISLKGIIQTLSKEQSLDTLKSWYLADSSGLGVVKSLDKSKRRINWPRGAPTERLLAVLELPGDPCSHPVLDLDLKVVLLVW